MRRKSFLRKAKLNYNPKFARSNEITPFTEEPGINDPRRQANKNAKGEQSQLSAAELFSLFTADIIRQDVIFTR